MAVTPLRRATDVPGQARELRAALEALSTALAGGDLAAVLAAEPALQAAVTMAATADGLSAEARAAATTDLAGARAALARCRAVGAANQELTDVTLDVLGRTGAYSRQGAGRPRDPRGRDLHARV